MEDINFLPEEKPHHHKRDVPPHIEYTSGTEPPTAKPQEPKKSEPQATQKKHSFLSWMKRKKTQPTPQMQPEPRSQPQQPKPEPVKPLMSKPQTQQLKPLLPTQAVTIPPVPQKPEPPLKAFIPPPAPTKAIPKPQAAAQVPEHSAKKIVVALPPHSREAAAHHTAAPTEPWLPLEYDVNFVPQHVKSSFKPRNYLRELGAIVLGCVSVVLAAYAGMNIYHNRIQQDTSELQKQIAQVERNIEEYRSLQRTASELNEQLRAAEMVLAKHMYWTPLFGFLEDYTLETVYYTSLSGSAATGNFTLSAVAPKFENIDQQVRAFTRSDAVQSVTTSSGSVQERTSTENPEETVSSVSFTLTVQFDPALFHYESSL